jgi:hypothetical protein
LTGGGPIKRSLRAGRLYIGREQFPCDWEFSGLEAGKNFTSRGFENAFQSIATLAN